MWADLERAQIATAESAEAKSEAVEKTRTLFDRMCKAKMKKRRAKFVFKRWMEFEEKEGEKKDVDRVQGIAKEWVERAQAKGGDEDDEE
jgi:rRNA biogenesis protein RRP5